MKEVRLVFVSLLISTIVSAQRLHLGIFGGLAAYNGDLTEQAFPKKVTNAGIGITGTYELRDQIMIRGGLTYAVVGGADRFSEDPEMLKRNLSFETQLIELSAVGEYYLFNLYDRSYSPYFFAGLAVYHFNPYTYNGSDTKVYLRPLGTEGQGLQGYANRRPYALTQLAIPVGAGVKFNINENLRVGVELGLRKLFTDHFDDVSTTYADPADLLAGRGQLAVDLSYRGDELAGGDQVYPVKGYQRGGADVKDYYYFTGIHLTYRLGSKEKGTGFFGGKGRRSYGCPTVPQ